MAVNSGADLMPLQQVIDELGMTFNDSRSFNPYTSYCVSFLLGRSALTLLHRYAEQREPREGGDS